METTRQQKIARQLQKDLGEIFLAFARNFSGTIISVTAVNVSPDLSVAKVYLSIFPSAKTKEILAEVEQKNKALRFELAQRVRNQLRIIPELSFFADDTLDYLENIDKLLRS